MQLQGKIAVVTGGNSGIGLAAAKEFAAQGAQVDLFGRDEKTLKGARRALDGNTLAVSGDVTKLADLERLFDQVRETFGRVNVLFANAGRTTLGVIEAVTEEAFDTEMDVYLKGAFFTVQKALPLMGEGAASSLTHQPWPTWRWRARASTARARRRSTASSGSCPRNSLREASASTP